MSIVSYWVLLFGSSVLLWLVPVIIIVVLCWRIFVIVGSVVGGMMLFSDLWIMYIGGLVVSEMSCGSVVC